MRLIMWLEFKEKETQKTKKQDWVSYLNLKDILDFSIKNLQANFILKEIPLRGNLEK